jgi:hypothetical protein
MIPTDIQHRFDDLCAGRALGDLSAEEERELAALCAQFGIAPDASLDVIAAVVHADALADSAETLPPQFAARLHQWADETAPEKTAITPANIVRPPASTWRRIALHPLTGWAAALVLLASLMANREQKPLAPAIAEQRLRTMAPDLIERQFTGLGEFTEAGGTVIWSDALQQGFMVLRGIPANDPRQAQYQLWIVDPARDPDAPVDGGVFDIPRDGSPAIIPIVAKLPLDNPKAFVITLEQPGGVVKSKQEQPVALAQG